MAFPSTRSGVTCSTRGCLSSTTGARQASWARTHSRRTSWDSEPMSGLFRSCSAMARRAARPGTPTSAGSSSVASRAPSTCWGPRAGMWTFATRVATRGPPTTPVATATAPSARASSKRRGSSSARGGSCRAATSTSSSPCRRNCVDSAGATPRRSTSCCSRPSRRPCSNSAMMKAAWVRRSASPPFFTPGLEALSCIPTCTASSLAAVCRRAATSGFPPDGGTSSPSRSSPACSGESSLIASASSMSEGISISAAAAASAGALD